jgi:hypothetical protein
MTIFLGLVFIVGYMAIPNTLAYALGARLESTHLGIWGITFLPWLFFGLYLVG